MPREPIRFLHAAGARIDHQLHQLPSLPDELRAVVERATLTAFERLVAAAIEHDVDFLLLIGDTFDAADRSLRARIALLDGLRQLAEHDIPVFITPGHGDPPEAWQQITDLPDNVTIFHDLQSPPANVSRNDQVLATIAPIRARAEQGTSSTALAVQFATHSEESTPPIQEYVALGATGARRTITASSSTTHVPGTLQATQPEETGPRGATLVQVNAEADIARTFLPVAPVRRARFEIDIDPTTSWDELHGRMENVLLQCVPEPGEDVWLVEWAVRGSGPVMDRLDDECERWTLSESLDWDAGMERGVRIHHYIIATYTPPLAAEESAAAGFAADFFEALAGLPVANALDHASLAEPEWQARVETAVAELDPDAILSQSRRLGLAWFGTPLEGPGT